MASGIYLIENKVNGRKYIGSAVNIDKRWKEHRRQLTEGRHHSRFMQRCWNKHGHESFEFRTLLLCSRDNLLFYEQALLDGWKPEYNTAPTAGSMLGFKMPEDARAKMSEAAKRTRNFTGRKHSCESREKISQSRKGKGGGPMSEERRAKIGAAHKGRVITPCQRAAISAKLTGTSTGRGTLTPEQVREIRILRESGLGRVRISKLLGITPSAANAVIGGHAYGWVK